MIQRSVTNLCRPLTCSKYLGWTSIVFRWWISPCTVLQGNNSRQEAGQLIQNKFGTKNCSKVVLDCWDPVSFLFTCTSQYHCMKSLMSRFLLNSWLMKVSSMIGGWLVWRPWKKQRIILMLWTVQVESKCIFQCYNRWVCRTCPNAHGNNDYLHVQNLLVQRAFFQSHVKYTRKYKRHHGSCWSANQGENGTEVWYGFCNTDHEKEGDSPHQNTSPAKL